MGEEGGGRLVSELTSFMQRNRQPVPRVLHEPIDRVPRIEVLLLLLTSLLIVEFNLGCLHGEHPRPGLSLHIRQALSVQNQSLRLLLLLLLLVSFIFLVHLLHPRAREGR